MFVRKIMAAYKVSAFLKWTIDALLVALITAAYWLLEFIPEPFHRGFFCDDDTIRYPYKPDTVSFVDAFIVPSLLVLIVILIIDLYLNYGTFWISNFLIILDDIFVFLFGMFASCFTCDSIKLRVGRLRPYFLTECFKNPAEIEALCPNGNEHYYVEDFVCTNTDSELRDIRMSFPSGHVSDISFSMAFLMIYLSKRINIKEFRLKFLVPFFHLVFVTLILYVSMTRSADYRHHWEDILAGAINGVCFALFCGFQLLSDRSKEEVSRPLLCENTRNYSYHSIGNGNT